MKKEFFRFLSFLFILLPLAVILKEVFIPLVIVFFFLFTFYFAWRKQLSYERSKKQCYGFKAYALILGSFLFKLALFVNLAVYFLCNVYLNRMLTFFFICAITLYVLFCRKLFHRWILPLPLFALFPLLFLINVISFNHRSQGIQNVIVKNPHVKPVLTYYHTSEEDALLVPGADYKKDVEEILSMDVSSSEKFLYVLLGSRRINKAYFMKITRDPRMAVSRSASMPFALDFIVHKGTQEKLVVLFENNEVATYNALTLKKLKTLRLHKKRMAGKLFDFSGSSLFFALQNGGLMESISAEHLRFLQHSKIQNFPATIVTSSSKKKIYVSSFFNPVILTELEAEKLHTLRTVKSAPWSSAPSFDYCERRKVFYMLDRLFGNILVVPVFLFDIHESIPFGKHADILAYDEKKDLLYIASSSRGYVYAFDPKQKKIKSAYFVGRGIRKILITAKSENMFVLSRYGIFQILN